MEIKKSSKYGFKPQNMPHIKGVKSNMYSNVRQAVSRGFGEDIANYKSLSYVGKGFQLLWNAIDFKLQWKNRESWCFPNLESKSRVNNNFNCYRIATIGSKIKKTTTLKMYFEGFL